jgi:hypothetical protein
MISSSLKRMILVSTASVAIFSICRPLFSQGNEGRILGNITDQSGGVIAGATVAVTDVDRGISRMLITDTAGEYNAPNLIPGAYTVRAQATGFRTIERQNILLEVGHEVRVDLRLQPGATTETITVTAAPPMVETTNATLGGTLSNQTINDLPLNGRNYENLLQYRPGIVIFPGGGMNSKSTNGLRPEDNVFLLDGMNDDEPYTGLSIVNGDTLAGDASTIIPIDAIQEFKTEVNPRAEYGWKPGGVINLGVKSGTNGLHGTAYAYGRDTSFDARNFFNYAPTPKTPVQLEQYGGTIGGRIKRDKLFYFLGYEDQRYAVASTYVSSAPVTVSLATPGNPAGNPNASIVDACRQAGFANLSKLTAHIADLQSDCSVGPKSLLPANPGTFNSTDPRATFPALSSNILADNGIGKVDYHISANHSLSGMFFIGDNNSLWNDAGAQVQPLGGAPNAWLTNLHIKSLVGEGNWTWSPSSTTVNVVRAGYSHFYQSFLSVDHSVDPATYGINTGVTNPVHFGFPVITINGFTAFQLGAGWPKIVGPDGNLQFVDHLSVLRGKHAFKFGAEMLHVTATVYVTTNAKGSIRFASLPAFVTGATAGAGSGPDRIFVGDPGRNLHNELYAGFWQDDWRINPRLTVNLGVRYELNSVLRESSNRLGNFDPAQGLVQTGMGMQDPYNGDHNNFAPRLGFAWDIRGNGKTVVRAGGSIVYEQLPFVAFLGIGNQIGLNIVPTGAQICVAGACKPGTGNIAAVAVTVPQAQVDWNGSAVGAATIFPSSALQIKCGDGIGTDGNPCVVPAVDRNLRNPYVSMWSLDLQRAITDNVTLEVGYVGNHSTKLLVPLDINQPRLQGGFSPGWGNPATPGTAANTCITSGYVTCTANAAAEAAARPFSARFPYISFIDQLSNADLSNYNGLQAILTARNYHRLSFTAGYTYAHAIDDVSGNFTASVPLDSLNPKLQYGSSNFDIRHRFTLTTTYAIPGKKSPGQLLEGWQVNSVVALQGGLPWGPVETSNDLTGTGENGNFSYFGTTWNFFGNASDFKGTPNGIPFFSKATNAACLARAQALDGGAAAAGLAQAALTNLGCYQRGGSVLIPAAYGSYGNTGRNTFRGAPFRNWDLSLTKGWKFKERLNAQFRAEVFNILNHPNFAIQAPANTNPTTPGPTGFGCACSTPDNARQNPVLGSGGNRAMQLGLKLIF